MSKNELNTRGGTVSSNVKKLAIALFVSFPITVELNSMTWSRVSEENKEVFYDYAQRLLIDYTPKEESKRAVEELGEQIRQAVLDLRKDGPVQDPQEDLFELLGKLASIFGWEVK